MYGGEKDEESIFENVLRYENAITELLRNFMRYRLFRNTFLSIIGIEDSSNVDYDHFYTQYSPEGMKGTPDLWIENDNHLIICLEVKTTSWRELTNYQQNEYLQYLEKNCKKRLCFYILLAPKHYQFKRQWLESVKSPLNVKCGFISWTDIYNRFKELDLAEISGIFREWLIYLRTNMMFPDLSLTKGECEMLFHKETGSSMQKIIRTKNLVEKALNSKYSIEKTRIDKIENEIGFYIKSKEDGSRCLWFGIWFDAWIKFGTPLCFGVDKNWHDKATIDAFKKEYKEEYIKEELDGYWIVPISKKLLRDNKDDESSVGEIIKTLENALECFMPQTKGA